MVPASTTSSPVVQTPSSWLPHLITAAVAAMIFGTNLDDGSVYGFEWVSKRQTARGTTGTCVIRHSNNATMGPGVSCRIHLCAFNPCAVHPFFAKYAPYATPVEMHLQQIPTPYVLPAVAVVVDPPLPPPDEPPPDLPQPADEPPDEPPPPPPELPPVAEPLTIGLPEVQIDDLFEPPDVPAFGVLEGVKPAAPAPALRQRLL